MPGDERERFTLQQQEDAYVQPLVNMIKKIFFLLSCLCVTYHQNVFLGEAFPSYFVLQATTFAVFGLFLDNPHTPTRVCPKI